MVKLIWTPHFYLIALISGISSSIQLSELINNKRIFNKKLFLEEIFEGNYRITNF